MIKEQFQKLIDAAESNDLDAIVQLKNYYINVYPNEEKENYYHKKAAALHYAPSEYVLGMGYLTGFNGIQIDKKLGVKYIQAAANDGIADAWFLLGQFHKNRSLDFIDFNQKKSDECFEKAAKMGYAMAQLELGDIYMFRHKEIGRAIFWWACAYLHDDEKDEENSKNAKDRLNELAKTGVPGGYQRINTIIEEVKKDYVQYTLRPQYIDKRLNK